MKAKSAGTGVRDSGSTIRKRINPVAITPVFIPKSAIALSNLIQQQETKLNAETMTNRRVGCSTEAQKKQETDKIPNYSLT